ncbi:MAG TPA: NAD(P)/FAD-dependent oxidoreductase [Chitinophagaceae bacterium]|nr:NAD(P)/FAD-dependent oxidoreductase [Chitinophagaceae bacterium]
MEPEPILDCAIAGGGIAGLSLAIRLSEMGYRTVVAERNQYPFHKVCGEYVSMESLSFLESIGFPFQAIQPAQVSRFLLTHPSGKQLRTSLPLGGFGISRYRFDQELSRIAREKGAQVVEKCKVTDLGFEEGAFLVKSDQGWWKSRTCCSCLGKKSLLDIKWKRKPPGGSFWIAVKYHIRGPFPTDTVSIHLFPGGYCGLSPIEEGRFCLCYLTTQEALKACGNEIGALEERVLGSNPYLREVLHCGEKVWPRPVTISGFRFTRRTLVDNHVLMMGDAAAMITPLCGNGMSMAMHAATLGAGLIREFLEGKTDREGMEKGYCQSWLRAFRGRLASGRVLQAILSRPLLAASAITLLDRLPGLASRIIRGTHGNTF